MVTIEGGGHASNLTHPKLVNLAIQQFLAGLEAPAPPRIEIERRTSQRRDQSVAGQMVAPIDRRMAERRVR